MENDKNKIRVPARPSGISFVFFSAILFGLSTPFAKMLTRDIAPIQLAGLLYFGSGIGLGSWLLVRPKSNVRLEAGLSGLDIPWLACSILFGGMLAPVLLMFGLRATPASTSALLLNIENVFTLLLAWFVFHENFDWKIIIGVIAILAGSIIISWAGMPVLALPYGPLLIAGACLSWAIDNNVTRKISSGDPVQIAAIKGLCAGLLLLIIGVSVHGKFVSPQNIIFAALLGIICYGLSLVFFVLGLRNLGAARTAAYFSLAPFAGAFASFILLGEKISFLFVIAATFMTIGIYLHISERHQHEHHHDELAHQHKHAHDEHHRHEHDNIEIIDESHSHWHKHQAMIHSHPHYPDIHHRHAHDGEHDN